VDLNRKEMTRNKRQRKLAPLAIGRFATSTPPFGRCKQRRAPRRISSRRAENRLVTCRAPRALLIAGLKWLSAASAALNRPAPARESTGGPSGRFQGLHALPLRGWCARYHSPSATHICSTSTLSMPRLKTGSILDQCDLYVIFAI